jgi:hypothetical protein
MLIAMVLSACPALIIGLLISDSDLMYIVHLPLGFGGQALIALTTACIVFFGLMFLLITDWIGRT